jgi:hypothetical protein
MDPRILYWGGALALMLFAVACAWRGVRRIRAGDREAHRRCMSLSLTLVLSFLLSYPVKLALIGPEDLAQWSRGSRLWLQAHESFVAVMLIGGLAARLAARRLRGATPRRREHGPIGRLHRMAGWTAVGGATLALATAAFVFQGMLSRARGVGADPGAVERTAAGDRPEAGFGARPQPGFAAETAAR